MVEHGVSVAWARSSVIIFSGPHVGCADFMRARTPATCGEAIEVPLLRPQPLSLTIVDRIERPGAETSIEPRPRLEKDDSVPARSSEETVMTPSSSVGMSSHELLIVRSTEVPSLGLESLVVLFDRS